MLRRPEGRLDTSSTTSLTPPPASHGPANSSETPIQGQDIRTLELMDETREKARRSSSWKKRRTDLRIDLNSAGSEPSPLDTSSGFPTSPIAQLQRRVSPARSGSDDDDNDESPRRSIDFSNRNGVRHLSSPVLLRRRRHARQTVVGILMGFSVLATLWSTFFLLLQQHSSVTTDRTFSQPDLGTRDFVRQEHPHRVIGISNPATLYEMSRDAMARATPVPKTTIPRFGNGEKSNTTSPADPKVIEMTNPPVAVGPVILSERTLPRVVHFPSGDNSPAEYNPLRILEDDPMLHAPPGFEAVPQDRMKPDESIGNCEPMHEWQTQSFPNCNSVHEIDLRSAGANVGNKTHVSFEDVVGLLGEGWFRQTWRWETGATNDAVVLKTLRLDREFYDEFYDLHRRDAIAMERLSHSMFVMRIYGYCGQSAINELADFGYGGITSLEKFNSNMRGNASPEANLLKLQLASSVAVGLAHVHEIDSPDPRPSMVHYDMNPRNIAIVKGGRPKLNDFNTAEFLRWDPTTNRTCGFPSRLHEPWWRAPEEVVTNSSTVTLVDEKVDVYALGNILFHILTTHSPRGKMKKERMEEVRADVVRGIPPSLPDHFAQSNDPAIKAIREAMHLCQAFEREKRASSRQVADTLLGALIKLKKQGTHRPRKRHSKL